MHLPDGFLNNQISVSLLAVSGGFLISSFYQARKLLFEKVAVAKTKLALADGPTSELSVSQKLKFSVAGKEKFKLMMTLAMLIFVFQLYDFPALGGHLLGGALLAITIGPSLGVLVMSSVLVVQAIFLRDGGIVALGANIFNIGIIAIFSSHYLYQFFASLKLSKFLNIGLTAWLGVMFSAIIYVLETNQLSLIKNYLIIGAIEALATILLIKLLKLRIYESK